MSDDKFDVIVVGAGLAGCTAAFLMAQAGMETLVIERGNFAGAKNMTGGRLYAHSLEAIFPGFADDAPVERCIVHEKISFMDETSSVTLDYASTASGSPAERSYSVLRSRLDPWLAEKAESAGAVFVTGVRVDDLLVRYGKVCGVIAGGEEMEADMVILADGVNSLLGEKLGMVHTVTPHHCAVGVKEVIELGRQKVNDRFGCCDKDGAAWLFAGMPSAGYMGGGFIYTNEDSISLGVVFGLHNTGRSAKSVPQMLEDFKNHPTVRPLVEGGKLVEYSAHVVPEGGMEMAPKLVGEGVLIVGDAAGFCLNAGYTVRGMDLAVASGKAAAVAAINAWQRADFGASSLSVYERELDGSFIMKDLRLYRKLPSFLDNRRMYNDYPAMATGMMKDLFTVNGPSRPLRKKMIPHLKKAGFMNLIKDGWKGVRSI
ncbi:FAD-dependent oxidoreductase [Desulfobotulus sp. H1]|uniref:FAD-dependent oxidoreductase n=1 Tax=Desulfobotulus pelophilus TaxID=2823377 RepID=A0ABT3NCA2_9BACT|nr:FAD-dependent oxidoreductase [Desulfobotulus pelophilus]MCW7754577.1 FAD-dependent oxidoreductase [Desulfobotulus pelophilus]